jgi:hypothetical protein
MFMRAPRGSKSAAGADPRNGAEPIARLIARDASLSTIRTGLDQLQLLQKIYSDLAQPPLDSAARVCGLADGVLYIAVDTSAAATLVRQQSPRLQRGFIARNQEVSKIKAVVQVASAIEPAPMRARGSWPSAQLASIAEAMSDSPLKAALLRLGPKASQGR